jgi:hypothetical protein
VCHPPQGEGSTGKAAAIGALKDLAAILRGVAGTTITTTGAGITWAS